MANIRAGTEAATAIPEIVAAMALGALKANTVLAQVVNRDYDNDVAEYGDIVNVQLRGALSANDKAENTVITLQVPSTTALPVALNKHKEVSFLVEDLAIMMARPDLIAGYGKDAGIAIAEQIDTDLAGLYSGLSQTIDATAGLAEANFREAQRLLNSAKAPTSDRWAVLHEDAYYEAGDIEKLINRDYQGDAAATAVAQGFLGFLSGFNVVMDQKIVVATSQCKNLFIHRNAIVLATRPMRQSESGNVSQTIMVEDGVILRVTMSYDHDYLGEKMTVDVLYGVAELRDSHGVAVSTTEI